MDIQYTYHGTQQRNGRPLERIGVDLHLSFPEEANPLGLSVKVKDQQNAGVLYFDAAEGRFVETQLRQKMVLETALGERAHQQVLDMNLRMQFVSDRTAARRAGSTPRTAVATPRIPARQPVPR